MRKPSLIAASCTALLAFPAIAADVPVIVKIPRMTVEASEKLARATMEACRKQGIQIGVTVVDRSGDAMVVMRDTLAPRITLEISQQKANTAVNFNAATSSMENRFTQPFSVGKVDGLVFSAGGVPIEAAGNIIGAVGVSGAATGAQDEACARAGIEAIQFELESASL
ncbi:MAG: adenosylcobalamin biosynthesis, GlcG-related protein [Thiobacillus sp. GWE1_62_9]|nr:MAG: adenosylcobalamin biosynthesis, GlcG-related protein [Thiobacillus sp. GWE1_62_9]